MKTIRFRELKATEIDLRVGSTKKDQNGTCVGFQLLLYKDARVDANILDETVGAFNWQKRFYQVKNTMICSVGINVNYDDETKEPLWVWKDDAGDESETEAIKGEASDSFKRASGGSCWGIGRALYGAPFVWIKCDIDNDPKKSHYLVSEIEYSNGEISKLVIINEKTKQVVYSCGSQYKVSKNADLTPQTPKQESKPIASSVKGSIREEEKKYINGYLNVCSDQDSVSFYNLIKQRFSAHSIDDLSAEQGIVVVKSLKRKLGE